MKTTLLLAGAEHPAMPQKGPVTAIGFVQVGCRSACAHYITTMRRDQRGGEKGMPGKPENFGCPHMCPLSNAFL